MQISNIGRNASFFGQQQNTAKREPSTNARRSAIMSPERNGDSVALALSNKAKSVLLQKQEERLTQMQERKTGFIKCDDPFIILTARNSDLALMVTRTNLDSEDMESWRNDWRSVATRWGFQASELMLDFYADLQTTLAPSLNFRGDFSNMISLANRFLELRQAILDKYDAGEICNEELDAMLEGLDEAFNFASEVLSGRAEHREASKPEVRDEQISTLQSMRSLMNVSGAMKVQLACGATIVFLGDSGEDAIHTDRVLDTDSHMPIEVLLAIRDSTRHLTNLTRNFVLEHGAVETQEDAQRLANALRQAPPIKGGFTFDELLERDQE